VIGVYFNGTGISLTGNVISNLRASQNAIVIGNITGGNVLTSGLMSATGNVTGGNLITGALAQAATLSVTGGATFSTVTAEIGIGNSMTSGVIYVGGPSQTGVMIFGQSTASQTVNLATGATASASTKTLNFGTNGAANSQTNINIGTSAGNAAVSFTANTTVAVANTGASALSVAGNITGGNIQTAGRVSAGGNVLGANFSTTGTVLAGSIGTGAISGTSMDVSSGSITGGSLSVTGNVTGGNINTAGLMSATGNITAAGNVAAGNVITRQLISNVATGTAPLSVSSTTVVTNLNADLLDGYNSSIANAASTVAVRDSAGNIAGNVFTGVGVSVTGNITGGNVLGGANVNATTHTGTTVSVTGNITGGNINTAGVVSATGNVLGGNIIQGGVRVMKWTTSVSTPSNAVAGDFWYEPNADKLYQYWNDGTNNVWVDQSQATTLSTLSVSGNATISGTLTATNISVSSGVWNVAGITNSGANGAGNIGNSTVTFNTVFAKATTAQYADLAENYLADAVYAPGTVLVFGGTAEVTVSNISHDTRIAGVVSTQPAYLMNSHQANGTPVALMGRVPCQVRGPVNKGDRLVNIAAGIAGRYDSELAQSGCIIGKSLQDIDSDRVDIIEIVVGKT
jgi:filamentous hemagglutinin